MAIWRRGKPDALLHHSDQGSQYTGEQWQRLMADNGITCSLCRSGNACDNTRDGQLLLVVRTERPQPAKPTGRADQARADVFDYIERFYTAKRAPFDARPPQPLELENRRALA